jgi:prolyl-tRNA synthetase
VIALADDGSYAANLEVAASVVPPAPHDQESLPLKEIPTPNVKTIDELVAFLRVPETRLAKSVVYWAGDEPVLALLLGNDELNEAKLSSAVGADVRPMEAERLRELTGADGGSIGPVRLGEHKPGGTPFRVVADLRLQNANNLISGANRNDVHLGNIDLGRDCAIEGYYDLRTARAGETAPNGTARLRIVRGIELGHIFKLGTKYSDALGARFLDEHGKEHPVIMGSYGIGMERIMACHIEQNHDKDGIVWDRALAPFAVHLIAVGSKSREVVDTSERLYGELTSAGVEVLFDDRKDTSPGFKFKDADLLGMPYQVIVGEKNLTQGKIEIKNRRTGERTFVETAAIVEHVRHLVA